jgi:hypothetical protein
MHKGFKYLDAATGHIYISHDVIFDESVFPFASKHPNAGARYHSDVLLEPNGNSASNNVDCAPAMTLLPILDSDVQVPIGSALVTTPALAISGTTLPDMVPGPPLNDAPATTAHLIPIPPNTKLTTQDADLLGPEDATKYRSLVGALQYVTLT